MINKKIGVLLLFALLVSFGAKAQRATSMRINEVLVINEDNFVDDYGKRHGWIELFNTSAGTVNIAGCFLTDDKNNPKKYPIPKGDVLTQIPPHQHTLFWADGEPNRGTFHTSCKLNPETANWIGLFDSGKKLLDQIVVPAGVLGPNQSYARISDGAANWEVKGGSSDKYVTPSTNNKTLDSNAKMEKFEEHDSVGIGMSISAMSVVFCGLILLYISFKIVGKVAVNLSKRNTMKSKGIDKETAKELSQAPGEVYAAISMALHEMQDEVHDVEETVLTITRVKRSYSPWSSKIYTLRENPNRK